MSILSFFFAGMAKNTMEAKNEIVPPDFPRVRTGTILHISTAGRLLLSGPVTNFSRTGVTISSPAGCLPFPACEAGTAVELEPEDGGGSLFLLRGKVELADGETCRLTGIEMMPRPGLAPNRPLFVELPSALYEEEDTGLARPEFCKLVQADNDGFTFQSEFPHCVEERVRVLLSVEGCAPLTMHGQIVRMEMSTTGVFRFELRPDGMEKTGSES